MYDKNGTLIAGAGTFADVVSTSVAYIKIRTAGQGILTSEGSPYTIEIITPQVYQDLDGSLQDEVLQVQLFLGLPFYLAAGEKGQVLTSSEPSYWINDTGFPSTPNHLYASIYKNGMYLVGGQNV